MRSQNGFTLLELLIAVSIFAVISTIAYSGLGAVLNTREHTEKTADRLSELQLALTIMQRDIEQATARSVRDEYGDSKEAFLGNSQSGSYIEFTKNGHSNPLKQVKSSLQHIIYHFSEGELTRTTWPALDAPQEMVTHTATLITGLTDVSFRYLDYKQKWQQQWPSESANTEQILPIAVEVLLEYKEWGEIKRLFRLAGSQE
jgi:general secretion pathway protein J